jgi:hypothetical protein
MPLRPRRPLPGALLLTGLSLLLLAPLAQAQSEAYRRGYDQGYADGLAAARQAPWQTGANPGWSGSFAASPAPITLHEARYGTAERACDARAGIARALANQAIPVLTVNNGLCGDPAPNQRKFLMVSYSCPGQGPVRQSGWEGQPLDLSCR